MNRCIPARVPKKRAWKVYEEFIQMENSIQSPPITQEILTTSGDDLFVGAVGVLVRLSFFFLF